MTLENSECSRACWVPRVASWWSLVERTDRDSEVSAPRDEQ